MRIYTYLTPYEIAMTGIDGLRPKAPKSRVAKAIQMYFNYTKCTLPYKDRQVRASIKAIYGGLVTSSILLNAKMRVYPQGEIVFFHIQPHKEYPIYIANVSYKNKLHMALLTKDKQSVKEYMQKYVDSIVPLSEFVEKINTLRKKRGGKFTPSQIRSYLERFEVIAYMNVEPEYLYAKLQHKNYIPFLIWLYMHRGIYISLIRQGKLTSEDYEKFLKRYNEFKKNYESSKRGVLYV